MAYSYSEKMDALDLWFELEGSMSVEDFADELEYPSSGCMRSWMSRLTRYTDSVRGAA